MGNITSGRTMLSEVMTLRVEIDLMPPISFGLRLNFIAPCLTPTSMTTTSFLTTLIAAFFCHLWFHFHNGRGGIESPSCMAGEISAHNS